MFVISRNAYVFLYFRNKLHILRCWEERILEVLQEQSWSTPHSNDHSYPPKPQNPKTPATWSKIDTKYFEIFICFNFLPQILINIKYKMEE